MSAYRIALLPGDGIGPECMDATRIVLDKIASDTRGLNLSFTSHRAGAELYRERGETLPREVLEDCLAADAVLLSAIGLPDVRQPDGTEVQPQMMVGLRRALGLHSAVRPVKLFPGAPCPLKDSGPGIDLVVVRENLEGLFASFGGGSVVGDDVATDTLVVTRKGTTQVVEYAFRLAGRRSGRPSDGQKMVTCVDKANVFRSLALFRRVFFDVAKAYPDIEANAIYVDAMSLYMVQNPWDFDVLVMENQFGDILSDLGARNRRWTRPRTIRRDWRATRIISAISRNRPGDRRPRHRQSAGHDSFGWHDVRLARRQTRRSGVCERGDLYRTGGGESAAATEMSGRPTLVGIQRRPRSRKP